MVAPPNQSLQGTPTASRCSAVGTLATLAAPELRRYADMDASVDTSAQIAEYRRYFDSIYLAGIPRLLNDDDAFLSLGVPLIL